MPALQTERLIVTPFTPALAQTALTGRMHLGRALGVRVPADWLRDDEEILPVIAGMPGADPADGVYARWGWWLIVHRTERTLIGEVSFRASPDGTGTVEIGYGVVPAYQGHGYATEAAGAALDWVLRRPGVRLRRVPVCDQCRRRGGCWRSWTCGRSARTGRCWFGSAGGVTRDHRSPLRCQRAVVDKGRRGRRGHGIAVERDDRAAHGGRQGSARRAIR